MNSTAFERGSEPSTAERARFRTHVVTLVCSVADARGKVSRAVLTAVSASRAIVSGTSARPLDARVRLDFGLGAKIGRVRVHGRTVAPAGDGAEHAPGSFHVRFDQPQLDLVERLERLSLRCPTAIGLDPSGQIEWPTAPASDRPSPDPAARGLQVWAGRAWARVSAPPGAAATDLQDPASRLTLLRRTLALLKTTTAANVAIAYRGRRLTSSGGVPCDELCAALRAENPAASAWFGAIDVALGVADFLDTIGRRLERLDLTHRSTIEALLARLGGSRLELAGELERARRGGARERVAVVTALDREQAELEVFLENLLVSVEWLSEPEPDDPGSWASLPASDDTAGDASRQRPSAARVAVALVSLAVIVGAVGFSAHVVTRPDLAQAVLPVARVDLESALPVDRLTVSGRRVEIQVPASWAELAIASRRSAMLVACGRLADLHYTDVSVRDPGGRELARWHDSVLDIR